MQIKVEVQDDWVIAALREMIENCLSTSLPQSLPMNQCAFETLCTALAFCQAANIVIEHCGGSPVALHRIKRYDQADEKFNIRGPMDV